MQYQTNTRDTGDQRKTHRNHIMQDYMYCHSYINYIGLKGGEKDHQPRPTTIDYDEYRIMFRNSHNFLNLRKEITNRRYQNDITRIIVSMTRFRVHREECWPKNKQRNVSDIAIMLKLSVHDKWPVFMTSVLESQPWPT